MDKSAEYHVDKHIVKMPLEAAQILCTTIWIDDLLGFVPRALNAEEREVMNKAKAEIKHLPLEERPYPYLPMMYNHLALSGQESLWKTMRGFIVMLMH